MQKWILKRWIILRATQSSKLKITCTTILFKVTNSQFGTSTAPPLIKVWNFSDQKSRVRVHCDATDKKYVHLPIKKKKKVEILSLCHICKFLKNEFWQFARFATFFKVKVRYNYFQRRFAFATQLRREISSSN